MRLGAPQDGGYVVPEAVVRRSAVVLSLGVKADWSFERAFHAVCGARVIGVDPSVGPGFFARTIGAGTVAMLTHALSDRRRARKEARRVRNAVDYFRFFMLRHRHVRKAVAGTAGPRAITLPSLLQMAAPPAPHSVFLKMDIEGSEYALIDALVDCHESFSGIVAEFHHLHRRPGAFDRAITRLLQHFVIVHVHGNNYGPCDPETGFPDVVEVTLVHAALMPRPLRAVAHEYPRPGLDRPNSPARPDYRLVFE